MSCQALSYRRSRCQNYQIRLLQPAGQAIEIGETCGDTHYRSTVFVQLIKLVHIVREDVAQGGEVATGMALADVEDELLGSVEGHIGVGFFVGGSGDLGGGMNQTAQDSVALNDTYEVLEVAAG